MIGLSAALGKVGAAVGTQVFTPIQTSLSTNGDVVKGQQGVFLIASGFSVLGAIVTWFFIPDMDKALETEDDVFARYLESKGFDIAVMGEALIDSASKNVVEKVGGREVASHV